jgi:two-component system cell cycle sensor histidine kinase/response regulator CckA
MKSHEGFLRVRSEPRRGAEFGLYFPALEARIETPAGPPKPALRPGQGETVLIIDDEIGVLELARAVLEMHNYRVLIAESGSTGLSLYRLHRDEVHAVITDMMMPDWQGAEVIRELRAINSEVCIVAMSGLVGERARVIEEPGRLAFLAKPMTGDDLVRSLQRVTPRKLEVNPVGLTA